MTTLMLTAALLLLAALLVIQVRRGSGSLSQADAGLKALYEASIQRQRELESALVASQQSQREAELSLARNQERLAAMDSARTEVDTQREQLKNEFKVVAQEALSQQSQMLQDQLKQGNRAELDVMLAPFRSKLDLFGERVEKTHLQGVQERSELKLRARAPRSEKDREVSGVGRTAAINVGDTCGAPTREKCAEIATVHETIRRRRRDVADARAGNARRIGGIAACVEFIAIEEAIEIAVDTEARLRAWRHERVGEFAARGGERKQRCRRKRRRIRAVRAERTRNEHPTTRFAIDAALHDEPEAARRVCDRDELIDARSVIRNARGRRLLPDTCVRP